MQPEEARARDEGERDQEEARIAPATGGDADRPPKCGGETCSAEDEPEVGGVVLPALVDGRPGQERQEEGEWRDDEPKDVPQTHRLGLYQRPSILTRR